jgi:hypothetical protein
LHRDEERLRKLLGHTLARSLFNHSHRALRKK